MNQDILFSDIQSWDAVRQAVNFPAQQGGALIICWVTLNWLQQHSGKPLNNEADILAEFSSMRFDLEELAEVMIEDESFDDDGDIVIE
ncbi:DUF1488 domain-containing protein [Photobacterium angustum]|uniref:Transcriptional regulator n=1 Tax=Photobacterium angustum TaxID=661 RepID=A0A2S7W1Y0_PHOAN|nr:DUF1488 domain-containing protein [Photobacterium angustum]PQJ68349.1 transcriptional regulator [Photobacterium angustum]